MIVAKRIEEFLSQMITSKKKQQRHVKSALELS
jgi:hypothetical protein